MIYQGFAQKYFHEIPSHFVPKYFCFGIPATPQGNGNGKHPFAPAEDRAPGMEPERRMEPCEPQESGRALRSARPILRGQVQCDKSIPSFSPKLPPSLFVNALKGLPPRVEWGSGQCRKMRCVGERPCFRVETSSPALAAENLPISAAGTHRTSSLSPICLTLAPVEQTTERSRGFFGGEAWRHARARRPDRQLNAVGYDHERPVARHLAQHLSREEHHRVALETLLCPPGSAPRPFRVCARRALRR